MAYLYVFAYLIAAALAVIFIVATPIVLIGGSLHYKSKIKTKYSNLKGTKSDFWLSPEEKQRFAKVATALGAAINSINKIKERGREEGLSKNRDGSFSRRSKRGKEINVAIEKCQTIIDGNISEYSQLKKLPQARWKQFSAAVIRTQAFLYGFCAWVLGAIIFMSAYASSYPAGIKTFVHVGPLAMQQALTGDDWKMLLGTTACGIIGYFISFLLTQNIPESRTPKPSEVSIKNYNDF